MKTICLALLLIGIHASCSKDDSPIEESFQELYFPPLTGDNWETINAESLGWNATKISDLLDYLDSNNTRAFIILKDGKIVIENYWGENFPGTASFGQNTNWYWASAGKTITAALTGIAQEEGFLDINHKTSDYLGTGWTSLSIEKEHLITIKNQLSMTTGLDYTVNDLFCTLPSCLSYKADAGYQWYYHNAPYTLLGEVISQATQMDYNKYTDDRLESKIGMNGEWIQVGSNNVYWSTARDMARFGLLMLNQGVWNTTPIISDKNYFTAMTNTSQNFNPSYGYLWWLNGKDSVIFPGSDMAIDIQLADNAPADLVAGLGKNGQFVEFIPSENIVVVRIGEAPNDSLVPIEFHNEMWANISAIIRN